jgi:3-oxoacyl-[acyl-carrier-protein] synthase III
MSFYITGYGAALADRVVPNAELAPLLDVSPDWIEANSGIRERRWASAEQATSDLAALAVCDALSDAGIGAEKVDYLIGCTLSPDYQVPGIAPLVQRKIEGMRHIPAVDVRVGCAGILYSLQLAGALIRSRMAKTVVCFGAEAQSKGLDLSNRSRETSMLFGDGAGAVVASDEPRVLSLRVIDISISTDGQFAEDLMVRAPGTANGARWIDAGQLSSGLHYGSMNGRSVILHAVRKLACAAIEITERNGLAIDEVDLVVPHQANANLLRSLAGKLSIPERKIVSNIDRLGNTGSASAFIALWQAYREGRLEEGCRVLMLAFAAGFTWGAAVGRVAQRG